ncbi:restriction endonuclease subunit S [Coprococcus eutactus]|nr:restriction endonuclease subunit S [Coprococcus eutactus]
MKKLTDICDIQYGYAFDSKCFTEDSSYPQLVRIRDVKKGYSETYYSGDYPKEYILTEGDLLIGMDGEFNIARWKCSGALLNQRVCKLTAKVGTNEEYLRFAMSKSLKEIEKRTAFVTVKHLSAKELNKLELDVPELSKQDKIADTLSRLERIIEAREEELEKLDDLIKARFVEMFGDPVNNEKGFVKAPMGDYMTVLTDFSSNGSYKTLDNGVTMYDEPNYAWMVRTTDLESGDMDSIKYIDESAYELLSKSKIFGGEIIMNKIGSAGKIYLMPQTDMPASLGRNAFMFRYDERINVKFLYHLLTSDYGQNEIQQYVRGAVTKTITKNDARSVLIIVPPIELQNEFEIFVNQVDKSKVVVQKALDETQILFNSLMQQYFG